MTAPALLDGLVYDWRDLAAFLHRDLDVEPALLALQMATNAVRSYTRGRGFLLGNDGRPVMAPELAGVVLTVAARLYSNPEGARAETVGAVSTTYATAGFQGFTLAELAVLHQWRRRAA